ncbi:MAG: hypothetical protein IJ184_03075 [Alphaproteobacteria bacterium]|nr:hypothetical protein [Alphaproteobacteria bacterium]
MSNKIKLQLELMSEGVTELEADGVVIPAVAGDITILSERAPSVFATDFGVVKLLDSNMQVKDSWYVSAGVADAAQGVVKLLVGRAVKTSDITKDEAAKLAASDVFYRMIEDKLAGKTESYI